MAKKQNLRDEFIKSFVFPGITLAALVVVIVVFSTLYVLTKKAVFVILLISLSSALLLLAWWISYLSVRRVYDISYKNIYQITKRNLHAIYSNDSSLVNYRNNNIEEVEKLNYEVEKLKSQFENAIIVSKNTDYSKLGFEYIPGLREVVSGKSLEQQIDNVIFLSNNYRNCLLEIYYEMNNNSLTMQEIHTVIDYLRSFFKDYDDKIIALNEDHKSIYMYLPKIDTFSRIEEQLGNLLQNISVVKGLEGGLSTISAKVVLVAYPYSNVDEMYHDLRYAKQAGKEINIYLPNRIIGTSETSLMKESTNINLVSKIMEYIGQLDVNSTNLDTYQSVISNAIQSLHTFLNADESGLITIDANTFDYISNINFSKSTNSLLKENSVVEKTFVLAMNEVKDIDKSYYFATRSHANNTLGRYFDRYRIASGFYYVLSNGDDVKGIIYFFNRKKDLVINSYLREGLVLFSSRISDYYFTITKEVESARAFEVIDSMLKESNNGTYRVDKETYEIIAMSKSMQDLYPDAQIGKVCYRSLHGLDRPCKECPILTSKKMVKRYKDYNLETSMVLEMKNTNRYYSMYIKNLKENEFSYDRFNRDYLINSYAALVEDISDAYLVTERGYLILLRIDNLDEMVSTYGSEITMVALRNFLKNIKNKHHGKQNLYYFNSQTFGVLCQNVGQIDILSICENIYDISKMKYFDDDKNINIKVTYLPMVYPSSYPTASDFIRNAFKFLDSDQYPINKDFVYFEENNYARSASRNEFMLSVVDDKFGNGTFNALLQPYLLANDRKVVGVEMLLRLTDDYRNIVFNADQLIKVAAANGKMKVISDALLNYAGNLYQKNGASIFKTFGLTRFSINIDYSYFQESDAIKNIIDTIESYNLPKNFIAFEIAEWDIKEHYLEYKSISEELKKHNIVLVADQFIEKSISLEKLKEIGINEIKIARSLGGFIDSDPQKNQTLSSIMTRAKEMGFVTSVVGIENHTQYEIIKQLDENAMVQGFYFFKPLDKNALINALRTETKIK